MGFLHKAIKIWSIDFTVWKIGVLDLEQLINMTYVAFMTWYYGEMVGDFFFNIESSGFNMACEQMRTSVIYNRCLHNTLIFFSKNCVI